MFSVPLSRFQMLHRRYQPAAVVLPRGLWILGGREGSMLLNTNEFLPYPHSDNRKKIRTWQWVHEKSRLPNDWDGVKMPLAMSRLPMALAGHCALRLGSKYTVVVGGGGNEFEAGIPVERTGPEPTNHVNIYNHRYNQ